MTKLESAFIIKKDKGRCRLISRCRDCFLSDKNVRDCTLTENDIKQMAKDYIKQAMNDLMEMRENG